MKLLRPGAVVLYILFLMLPIYWLVIMSFKTTNEILGGFSAWPQVWINRRCLWVARNSRTRRLRPSRTGSIRALTGMPTSS